jgi:DNA polymerase III subunit delta'
MLKVETLHPNIYNRFIQAFSTNQLSHAYLFDGTEGSGTLDMAKWVAKRKFCKKIIEQKPCEECQDCRRIEEFNHPDVHLVIPEGQSIGIDQIRILKGKFHLKGVEGNKKCFIIKHVDKMTTQAANALLKFLEEPEGNALAILLTERKERLLDTILSRVQLVSFTKVHHSVVDTILRREGYDGEYLSILTSITDEKEKLIEFLEDGWSDKSIRLVFDTIETYGSNFYEALIKVQIDWPDLFKNKSQQLHSIDLMESYFKSCLHEKKEGKSLWGFYGFEIQQSSWLTVVSQLEACHKAKRALRSNTHYLLVLENLLDSLKHSDKINLY